MKPYLPPGMQRLGQRGVATVLMALLVGTAVVASTFAVTQYVRTSQEQSFTVHAQTQAQMNAWAAAELVRQYLAGLSATQRATLLTSVQAGSATGTVLTFSTGANTMGARLMNTSTASDFVAQVTGTTAATSAKAKSTATLELHYTVSGGNGLSTLTTVFKSGMNTKLEGSITIAKDASAQSVINIVGDLSTGGNSITGADTINATGTINIGSGSSYQILNSNCDVVISGGVQVVTINARRHVCGSGGTKVSGVATANGSINMATTGNGTLAALADTAFTDSCSATGSTGGGASNVAATCAEPQGAGVDLHTGNNNGQASSVRTKGNVYIGSGSIGSLVAGNDLVLKAGGANVNGTVGGSIVGNGFGYNGTVTTGGPSPAITAVAAVTITPDNQFNATDYRSYANYAFYVSGGNLLVDVKNVNSVTDGTYLLGNANGNARYDYLCPTSNNACNQNNATMNLCVTSQCIRYDASLQRWYVGNDTNPIRPGVVWFSGDLDAGNGTYYNTFIATGSIATSGSHVTYAPSYAGYSGAVDGTTYAPSGVCTTAAGTTVAYYPSNFCNTASASYDATAAAGLGSYAYMAGSFSGSTYQASSYVGGNVALASSTNVFGYVLAGNAFTSAGSSTVRGYVSAQGLGASNPAQATKISSLGSNTTINAQTLPSTMTTDNSKSTVTIAYARYL